MKDQIKREVARKRAFLNFCPMLFKTKNLIGIDFADVKVAEKDEGLAVAFVIKWDPYGKTAAQPALEEFLRHDASESDSTNV